MTRRMLVAITAVAALFLSARGADGREAKRGDLGRTEKLRILVDKVMQPEEGWVTKEWIVREAAEAGFNVFSPRCGHDRLDEVRQVTQWCENYGIFHMPWMRGSLEAPRGPEADGKRVLWAGGSEQPLWSPASDEFWQWTTKHVVEYAKLSAQTDRVLGVFLDYENYWRGGQGNLYRITYEDVILKPFLDSKGLAPATPEPGARKAWLEERGLHDDFAAFQIDHWRKRCRALREEVDKHDPGFQFCIYPSPGTPFMVEACYPEWSTEQAPIILADPWVYGRPSRFLPQHEALEANRQKLLDGMKVPQAAHIPFIYSGGIDPVVRGADAEFCGKNAVMISELTGGYWVFYEGIKYDKEHPDYFRWFQWANDQIAAGRLQAWHEPRQTPEQWVLDVFEKAGGGVRVAPPEVTGATAEFGRVTLRNDNLMLLAAKRGQPVELALRNVPVGRYVSMLVWDVRDTNMERIASGTMPHNASGTVRFTPEQDGVYLLGVSSGSCAYTMLSANVPAGILASEGASLIYVARPMYFHVPKGVDEFAIAAKGSGAETVRVNVMRPDGEQVATGQTTLAGATVEIKVAAGDHAGKTWSLATAKADEGVVEDYSIRFSANVPPVLSLVPEHVFTVRPGE
ncbi:MAG TPA: hypothetical protein VMY37_03025 [Thermoguttaceae bacterium]|nr:hypothetical protein [Thermoguttaceae bacterium]